MSKTTTFENDIQQLIFNNVDISNLGDASGVQGSTSAGSLYIALFSADPGEAGVQTNEATFGAYARQAVARTVGGWTVSADTVSNAAEISFPEATSGTQTITHFGIMDSLTSGTMLYHGSLTTPREVSTGVTLKFSVGTLTVTEQ